MLFACNKSFCGVVALAGCDTPATVASSSNKFLDLFTSMFATTIQVHASVHCTAITQLICNTENYAIQFESRRFSTLNLATLSTKQQRALILHIAAAAIPCCVDTIKP